MNTSKLETNTQTIEQLTAERDGERLRAEKAEMACELLQRGKYGILHLQSRIFELQAACAEKDYALSEIATHLDPIYMALEETKLQVRDSPDDKSYWDHEIKAWFSYSELVRRSVSSKLRSGHISKSELGKTIESLRK